jgi:replication-associated recombination protein RarA
MYKRSFINNIIAKIKEYTRAPSAYRVFILFGAPISGKTTIAKEILKQLDGEYVDLLKDKLNIMSPKLGRYSPLDFKHDINLWAKETESLLVIDEIEALFDTWTKEKQEDLFKLISKLRTDSVVLIITRLNLAYEDIVDENRVFRIP